MSSDAQASEMLVGVLKRSMSSLFLHSLSFTSILFLVCSLIEFSNWKPLWHASFPALPLTAQILIHILKRLPHFLAPFNQLMPSLRSKLIYAMLWMKSGVKIPRWIPCILLDILDSKHESVTWKR